MYYSVLHICPLPFLVENNDRNNQAKRHTRTRRNNVIAHQRVHELFIIAFPFLSICKNEAEKQRRQRKHRNGQNMHFPSPVVADPSDEMCFPLSLSLPSNGVAIAVQR